jgi:hypothetical protein
MSRSDQRLYDVFISHAREDKERFVDALDVALRERGVTCWYDSREIRLGDDFRVKMDEGLAHARYGVVILSPNFFKYWPQAELSALFNQEAVFERSRILPVRLDLDRATMTTRLPLLAARVGIGWEQGVVAVAERIRDVVRAGTAAPGSAEAGSASMTAVARSRPYNLPARRVQTLFGREADIDQVLDSLRPGRSVRVAASIEGLAGLGKTELALHLVDRLSQTDRFAGGIFWFDAENPNLAPTWGGVIADALAVGPGMLEERAAAAVRLASTGPPILVVLDNVERWTRDSEPHPLPVGSHVSVLVTTRHRSLGGFSFHHHTLEILGATAARALLEAISGRLLDREHGTEALLAHLDGHALALELAGAYLREFPTVSPQQYLNDLVSGGHAEERVKDLVRYERSVRQALDVHARHLDSTSRRALQISACFALEDASTRLLELCGVGPDVQQPLRRFHLITGKADRWCMHRLVRSWVHSNGTSEELEVARRSFVKGCIALAADIDFENGFRVYRADGPHLDLAAADIVQVFGESDDRTADLLDSVGTALYSAGNLPRAKALLEQAVALALKNRSADRLALPTYQSNLAVVLRATGELPRAKELQEQALALGLDTLGADDLAVAARRSHLARVLKDLGDLPRAKELLEQVLASQERNLGLSHPSLATNWSNLALVLRDLGDLPGAKELLETGTGIGD